MNEQLSFFETSPPSDVVYSLVLGMFPDDQTKQQISQFGSSFLKIHGLRGRMRPTSHLHVSLPVSRHVMYPPEAAIENVGRACNAVATVMSRFEIKFDRVMSFRGRPGNHPLVLADDGHENRDARKLHGLLWAEFTKNISSRFSTPKFTPHLTLLYGNEQLAPICIKPVCWTVQEIVLVLSEVGATKYHRLGCWRLRSDL